MNIFFKEIQKSFDLLDHQKTKKSSFMTALEYMLKIANESKHEPETCTISADQNGDIVIVLKTKRSQLTITAGSRISYIGTSPREKDRICITNTESYCVGSDIFEWIKRNSKEIKVKVTVEHDGIPEGSVITVTKELKYSYKGIWSSMAGSLKVKVKKKYCIKCNE